MIKPNIPLPIIDLNEDDATCAAAIDLACREIGFFAITGHGVAAEATEEITLAALQFFTLPTVVKSRLRVTGANQPYGWAYPDHERLAATRGEQTPPDLKETYAIGSIDRREADQTIDQIFARAPNFWPEQWPEFRYSFETYYRAMSILADRLMGLCAISLGLPKDYFCPFIDRHISALRTSYYPALSGLPIVGQNRAGAHTDFGTLTILARPEGGHSKDDGLQVVTRAGAWIDVPHVPGGLVINIGDLMARWTNDRWVSTLHRVTQKDDINRPRLSIAFFHQPNWAAEITCLPTCLGSNELPKYAPITSGTYLMSKYQESTKDST